MKEHKFRVRDTLENKWVSANILLDHSGLLLWSFAGNHELVGDPVGIRYVVQFYTGCKDKNGKEMWEGDVVELPIMAGEKRTKATIVFAGAAFRYSSSDFFWHDEDLEPDRTQKIGNIYENPELLDSE